MVKVLILTQKWCIMYLFHNRFFQYSIRIQFWTLKLVCSLAGTIKKLFGQVNYTRMQACHNVSVEKPGIFFKNVQSARATNIFQKCRLGTRQPFKKKRPRLAVVQPFFCIRHYHKHDSTAFYQINIECTVYTCSQYLHYDKIFKKFISFFLLHKRSKHKFWTLISRSQGS